MQFWRRRLAEARERLDQDGRDPAFDGIRGIAVFLVFLMHAYRVIDPLAPADPTLQLALRTISVTGQAGVHLFFVLSGFLVYGLVLERRPAYGPFLARRVQRIYPTYLVVVALYLGVCLLAPGMSKLPQGAGPAAEYVARTLVLLPGLEPARPLISVAWTLRYEMVFYMLVGLVALMPAFVRLAGSERAVFALLLLPVALWSAGTIPMTLFVFGILAREAYLALGDRHLDTRWIAWAVVAAAVLASIFKFVPELRFDYPQMPQWLAQSNQRLRHVLSGLTLGAAVWLAAMGGNAIARFGAWKPVRAFGLVSYSYYLSHGLALHAMEWGLTPVVESGRRSAALAAAVFVAALALTTATALALFLAVELPASLRKRLFY